MLQKVGPPMGMAVKDPMVLELKDDRTETFIRSIRDNLSEQVKTNFNISVEYCEVVHCGFPLLFR